MDIAQPNQVLIGLEITDFAGIINEEALVGSWQTVPGRARLIYRYRPKLNVREDLESDEISPGELKSSDYHWEIVGGGDPAIDLVDIEWYQDIGSAIRFADLQSFLVVFLPALRDVESDLRQFRNSPLARLINAMEINDDDQEVLLGGLRQANDEIATAPLVREIASAIETSFQNVAGPAFSMDITLGLSEPSFQAIIRSLRILLSNQMVQNFDPTCNGLGLNNILYVSILIEYFRKRLVQHKTAGQLILFEEPEAHIHPQLQTTLYKALSQLPFQSILTTHSTNITANADLKSYVILTQTQDSTIASSVPANVPQLCENDISDLKRYLDVTKSNLLFARKVILVEGPAELFLIPALIKHVKGIDLDRESISIIPIYGVHFDVYAKLFSNNSLRKKCAIITDGDLKPSDSYPDLEGEDDLPSLPTLDELENQYLHVFRCRTTFERAVTMKGTLNMLSLAADDIGAPKIAERLRRGIDELSRATKGSQEYNRILEPLRKSVLNTAIRYGKARFSQLAARHAERATSIPKYITEAVEWLIES